MTRNAFTYSTPYFPKAQRPSRHLPGIGAWLLLCLMTLFSAQQTMAQEVYKMVYESAARTLQNPMSGYTQTRIARFKLDALQYLEQQTTERLDEQERAPLLDTQAYYLSEFITLYFKEILKNRKRGANEEKQRERVTLFMDASKSNPLFPDTDTSRTDVYITDGNQLTPFCLNTDWQKAFYAAKVNI